jgi:hypothetical protein
MRVRIARPWAVEAGDGVQAKPEGRQIQLGVLAGYDEPREKLLRD